MAGGGKPLDLVGTRSADGRWIVLKLVNPSRDAVPVEVTLPEGFAAASAVLERVAPGSLSARNTLERPDAVRSERAPAAVEGGKVRIEMPALSAAVLAATPS